MTSVWSQAFGGNPLGLEDALVVFYIVQYLFLLLRSASFGLQPQL